MTLFNTDPNTDPNTDLNTDLNTDPNTDPNTDIFYFNTKSPFLKNHVNSEMGF
ncbi:hypothetical protein [Lactococcus lactis]|uniref:hypothetical protein n=1 Tax=Lactococcus lactis TaxID=1358 RepID=UPI00072AFE26|nr:hypothetical protein [Lactococcus lactis]KST99411.1 hypothetical protein KF196_0768 [Lactococcus lactis subsp. lactis]